MLEGTWNVLEGSRQSGFFLCCLATSGTFCLQVPGPQGMSLTAILYERELESLHQGAPEKGPTY